MLNPSLREVHQRHYNYAALRSLCSAQIGALPPELTPPTVTQLSAAAEVQSSSRVAPPALAPGPPPVDDADSLDEIALLAGSEGAEGTDWGEDEED